MVRPKMARLKHFMHTRPETVDGPGIGRQKLSLGFETGVGVPELSLELVKLIELVIELKIFCHCRIVQDN